MRCMQETGKKRSDVLTVVRFLQKVLDNEDDWAVKGIARLLTEDCGLFSSENVDIFANRFGFLKRKALTAEALYADILQKNISFNNWRQLASL